MSSRKKPKTSHANSSTPTTSCSATRPPLFRARDHAAPRALGGAGLRRPRRLAEGRRGRPAVRDDARAYGGAGGDRLYSTVLIEEVARVGASRPRASRCTPTSSRYLLNLRHRGAEAAWLPRMARGETIGAIAMTEPGAGSDLQCDPHHRQARRRPLRAQRLEDLHHQRLERRPRRSSSPRPTRAGAKGISLLLVEAGMPGFSQGQAAQEDRA